MGGLTPNGERGDTVKTVLSIEHGLQGTGSKSRASEKWGTQGRIMSSDKEEEEEREDGEGGGEAGGRR